MSDRAFINRMANNVSARDREAIRRACVLAGDPAVEQLAEVEVTKRQRIAGARVACRERRARREFIAAHPPQSHRPPSAGPVLLGEVVAIVMGEIAQRVAARYPEDAPRS